MHCQGEKADNSAMSGKLSTPTCPATVMFSDSLNARSKSITAADLDTYGVRVLYYFIHI